MVVRLGWLDVKLRPALNSRTGYSGQWLYNHDMVVRLARLSK